LKGPLHGGANAAVMAMLRQIGSEDKVDAFLAHAFESGDKIMGFGHRVYKNGDPRAKILRSMSERLTSEIGRPDLYRMSQKLEKLMGEKKGLIPNVDFYSATVYNALGIPDDLFTPIFAASRIAGWCAHIIEQYNNNRIYRPRARYIGRTDARYEPIEQR
jgi:citrate synthase